MMDVFNWEPQQWATFMLQSNMSRCTDWERDKQYWNMKASLAFAFKKKSFGSVIQILTSSKRSKATSPAAL